jgi:hypothetical protein
MFSFLPGCSEVFSQLVVRLRTVIEGNTQQLENKELLQHIEKFCYALEIEDRAGYLH